MGLFVKMDSNFTNPFFSDHSGLVVAETCGLWTCALAHLWLRGGGGGGGLILYVGNKSPVNPE